MGQPMDQPLAERQFHDVQATLRAPFAMRSERPFAQRSERPFRSLEVHIFHFPLKSREAGPGGDGLGHLHLQMEP